MAGNYLIRYGQTQHFSALSISVMQPGVSDPITASAGCISLATNQKIDNEHLFQVGSLVKSMIAVLILKHQGSQLHLDDDLGKFLPQYPKWRHIKIRQLLNMTSGITDYFRIEHNLHAYALTPFTYHHANSWLDQAHSFELLFKPGSNYDYSNTNYILLGKVIEKITDKPLAKTVRDEIILPYGLTQTHFISHLTPLTLLPYLVEGYQMQPEFNAYVKVGSEVRRKSLSYLGAAGGLISTSTDMSKWISKLMTPDVVLNQSQFKQLTSLVSEQTGRNVKHLSTHDPYGFGLGIGAQYSKNLNTVIYLHEGITLGYRALYLYVPSKKVAIALTINSNYRDKDKMLADVVNDIGAHIIKK